MQPQPTPTHPEAETDTQYYRRILHGLIDMASDLAQIVHHQATQPAPATPAQLPAITPDPTQAFDRIARAIRRTIALARSLAEPIPAPRATQIPNCEAARRRILREVEDAIHRTATGPDAETRAVRLHAEALDHLDSPDLDADIAHLPIAQVIADICRDLGIASVGNRPWKRRTPADVALMNTRAAHPNLSFPHGAEDGEAAPGPKGSRPWSARGGPGEGGLPPPAASPSQV